MIYYVSINYDTSIFLFSFIRKREKKEVKKHRPSGTHLTTTPRPHKQSIKHCLLLFTRLDDDHAIISWTSVRYKATKGAGVCSFVQGNGQRSGHLSEIGGPRYWTLHIFSSLGISISFSHARRPWSCSTLLSSPVPSAAPNRNTNQPSVSLNYSYIAGNYTKTMTATSNEQLDLISRFANKISTGVSVAR